MSVIAFSRRLLAIDAQAVAFRLPARQALGGWSPKWVVSFIGKECIAMRSAKIVRRVQLVATGWVLLQAGGCSTAQMIELIQTVFLGITAAGSIAILQNI
jgi:hypothetical protein